MNNTLLDDEIPEKFKDSKTGEVKIDAMAKSYRALEKKMSNMPSLPASHEEYCVNCDHGLFEEDAELNKKFFEKGFSKEQVQFIYDTAADKIVPLAVQLAGDFQADREIEKLIEYFGGVEKWKEVAQQLLTYGQKNLPTDVLDSLSSSYEGVLALHNMMKGNEPVVSGAENNQSISLEAEVQSMMRDPKYWRDKDLSYVSKVTEKFQNLYGNK